MHTDPGLCPSFVDIVVAKNDNVRKRVGSQNFEYNGIHVSVDKITQKCHSFPEDQPVFITQSADLSNNFGCDLEQNQTGIMKGKGPNYSQCYYDIMQIPSLLVYSDNIEFTIIVKTKTLLLRSIPFISKV